jgi:hypothetical protein
MYVQQSEISRIVPIVQGRHPPCGSGTQDNNPNLKNEKADY